LVQVHAETESDHRCLKQEFGEISCFQMERVLKSEPVEQPNHESQRWREQAARGEDHSYEEDVFRHRDSLDELNSRVQAEEMMPHQADLWGCA
jgi:hypothetical protein